MNIPEGVRRTLSSGLLLAIAVGLRIPGEMGHWFRLKWGSHSDRSGALIPAGSGALFG